jgi:hypothetical protein
LDLTEAAAPLQGTVWWVSDDQLKREKMRSGNDAPKLIVEALLQRFLPLARRRIDTAQAQVLSLLNSPIGFKFKASINFGLQLLKGKTMV